MFDYGKLRIKPADNSCQRGAMNIASGRRHILNADLVGNARVVEAKSPANARVYAKNAVRNRHSKRSRPTEIGLENHGLRLLIVEPERLSEVRYERLSDLRV